MKIKAIAKTERGAPSFTIIDKETFFEQIEKMHGNIQITVEHIPEEATAAQRYRLNCMVNDFMNLSSNSGTIISESESEQFLLSEVCKMKRTSIESLSKHEVSACIERIETFFRETFFDYQK